MKVIMKYFSGGMKPKRGSTSPIIDYKGNALNIIKTTGKSSSSISPLLRKHNECQLHTYGSSNGIQNMPEEVVIEAIQTCRTNSTNEITRDKYEIVFEPKPNQEVVSETLFDELISTQDSHRKQE